MTTNITAHAQNAAHHLDLYRFLDADGNTDQVERVLARYDEGEGARYDDSETLETNGLDLEMLGIAMTHGLDIRGFSDIIARGEHSIDELNGLVEHFIDASEEALAEPNPAVRAFARIEGCGFDRFAA
ncbi:MAG: hypothetical protein R3C24_19190 [Cyanobacteriota/Melainabacteria group bacterium]